MLKKLKAWHLAAFFGVVYLFSGFLSLNQFGISYDEEIQRYNNGLYNYNYITGENKESLINGNEKYHGPVFEVALILVEKAFKLTDKKDIYFARHLVNFLVFFLSLVVMFFLGRGIFKDDKWALFAALAYGLSPRFFAEAFYNSKDIIFLAFVVFSLYTLLRFVNKPNLKWAIIHAMVTGIMIDVRIIGVFMPIVTLCLMLYRHILADSTTKDFGKAIGYTAASLLLLIGVVIAFWPILWEGPIHHLREALIEMSHYHWLGGIKYLGEIYPENKLPWHYLPVWILLTLPVSILLLVFIGSALLVTKLFSFRKEVFKKYEFDFLALSLFIGPLVLIITNKSIVYDGWRHVYFVYAPMVLVATRAIIWLWDVISKAISKERQQVALIVLFVIVLAGPLFSLIRYHPHQYVYFNLVATSLFSPLEENFEMDYWGLSYKDGLEYILNNNEGSVDLIVEHSPGYDNQFMFEKAKRNRLRYVGNYYKTGTYYLVDYRSSTTLEPKIKSEFVRKFEVAGGAFLWLYKTIDSIPVKQVVYNEVHDFENQENSVIDPSAPSGQKVDKVGPGKIYGYTLRKTVDSTYTNSIFRMRVRAKFKSAALEPNISYVFSVQREDENIYWHGRWLGGIFDGSNEWIDWSFAYDLKDIEIKAGDEWTLYLMSGEDADVFQDDLEISFLTYDKESLPIDKKELNYNREF